MKHLLLLFIIVMLSGCAMSVGNGQYINYQGDNILSEQAAKALPRQERMTTITSDMDKVGFQRTKVSYLFDAFSDSVLSIYRNQYELMKEHKSLLDNHKDVMSFLMANKGKDDRELQTAIKEFDSTAETEEQKIGPKIKEYEGASDRIWKENAKLTLEIAAQAVELGVVIYNSTKGDKKIEHLIAADLLSMLASANKLQKAYKLAEVRLHLAKVANDFIKDEQAIIDISKRLQEYQNEN